VAGSFGGAGEYLRSQPGIARASLGAEDMLCRIESRKALI
jgi:hypothetical protein